MQLTVAGLDAAPIRFKHLWGRYVTGFRPWHHCIACFQSRKEAAITPEMQDGTHPLRDDLQLFYLCGVGQPDSRRAGPAFNRKHTNVHLAVTPRQGSVAAIGSVYGVTFTITDAEMIPIQPLPEGFRGLPDKHWKCKNFQFGYQMFAADQVGEAARPTVITAVRAPSPLGLIDKTPNR